MRHNNCVILSIFLYFKYSFLSNSFIYKFVHTIIFLFIKTKSYQLLIWRVTKNLPALELLNHFIKSSTVAYTWVAYKKNLVDAVLSSCLFCLYECVIVWGCRGKRVSIYVFTVKISYHHSMTIPRTLSLLFGLTYKTTKFSFSLFFK